MLPKYPYFFTVFVFAVMCYQQNLIAVDLYDNTEIDRRIAIYEYIDPDGNSRSIDDISETRFINEFIAQKYAAYETDIDGQISDKSGNHLAIACLEGELYTKNIVWIRARVGEWQTTVLVTQRCYQKWYKPAKKAEEAQLVYQKEHSSKTVRTPFIFTLKFKECRSGNVGYAAENCESRTGYGRNVR